MDEGWENKGRPKEWVRMNVGQRTGVERTKQGRMLDRGRTEERREKVGGRV